MKNRKIFIALLLVASLALGIGYAALADKLYTDVTAGINQGDANSAFGENVYFTNIMADATKVTATIGTDKDTHANDLLTIAVNDGVLKEAGDYVTCGVDIVNEGDLKAYVSLDAATLVPTNTSVGDGATLDITEYFEITTSWANNAVPNAAEINPASDTDIVFTIRVKKTPVVSVGAKFNIAINVSTETSGTP